MKKIGFLTLLILATVLIALAFSVAAAGPKAPAAPVSAAAAAPATPSAAAMPAPHPHIQAALEAMHRAHKELEDAAHDFHGHRVKAIEHLDQAIKEAEICEQEP
jgi:Skp family chaperone for outer membrane proteins